MRHRQISTTTKLIITVCTLLLAVNVILGILFMNQSGESLRSLIRRHMISVAETASAMVDAEELAALTAEDVGSESFERIADTLRVIKNAQHDMDIKYIYLVKQEGDHYVYTVDPDPEEPADFGEEVVDTPAQDAAWAGTAEIDPEPIEDEWGCYYTAWSPVKDDAGTTVGMVGIDFAADWYDSQMSRHSLTVVLVSCLSLGISLVIMILMMWQLRRRFRKLDVELTVLAQNVEDLAQAVSEHSETDGIRTESAAETSDSDMILALSEKINTTQNLLTDYMQYIRKQAFTDDMTGAGNRDAYLQRVEKICQDIDAGCASFSVAIFDINGLKTTNDNYGHECGDQIIIDTARQISAVFGSENVYRIGGDEFIAVTDITDERELQACFVCMKTSIDRFNESERCYEVPLSFSWGSAVYRPNGHDSYKEVFKRADTVMYRNKSAYYQEFGDRPEHYE